jgi:hypothetical protein
MRKPYQEPTLTRFGEFRDLTQNAGKTVVGFDAHPQHGETMCNPNPGQPGQPACS